MPTGRQASVRGVDSRCPSLQAGVTEDIAMATLRQIKRRIRSIQSTAKITRAMELVAASKMRRTQIRA